jgi:hypothetical protein
MRVEMELCKVKNFNLLCKDRGSLDLVDCISIPSLEKATSYSQVLFQATWCVSGIKFFIDSKSFKLLEVCFRYNRQLRLRRLSVLLKRTLLLFRKFNFNFYDLKVHLLTTKRFEKGCDPQTLFINRTKCLHTAYFQRFLGLAKLSLAWQLLLLKNSLPCHI